MITVILRKEQEKEEKNSMKIEKANTVNQIMLRETAGISVIIC